MGAEACAHPTHRRSMNAPKHKYAPLLPPTGSALCEWRVVWCVVAAFFEGLFYYLAVVMRTVLIVPANPYLPSISDGINADDAQAIIVVTFGIVFLMENAAYYTLFGFRVDHWARRGSKDKRSLTEFQASCALFVIRFTIGLLSLYLGLLVVIVREKSNLNAHDPLALAFAVLYGVSEACAQAQRLWETRQSLYPWPSYEQRVAGHVGEFLVATAALVTGVMFLLRFSACPGNCGPIMEYLCGGFGVLLSAFKFLD